MMKKPVFLFCLVVAAMPASLHRAAAQDGAALHVVKYEINAESENAELCLEFDKALAAATGARLAAGLHLEAEGRAVIPANIAATGTSLCLFPLERGISYRLDIAGLRGADDEKMAAPYKLSFTVPDRSPSLAFTGRNGGVNGFDFYDDPLTLRAVNVAQAKIEIYRIAALTAQARAWQDRAQTSLAPSESAYLARDKGNPVWQGESVFEGPPNATAEQKISIQDKLPDLAPGLYLIVADAGDGNAKPASKGLAPLAAAWFTKSDFTLRALRDEDGIHVFVASLSSPEAKTGLRLVAMSKKPEPLAEAQTGTDGIGLIPYPRDLADRNDIASVVGVDANGAVAFADIEDLPPLSSVSALGTIRPDRFHAAPGENIDISLSFAAPENISNPAPAGILRLSRDDAAYADFEAQAAAQAGAKVSFPAPAVQGLWNLRWQKTDGTRLANGTMYVTANADAPRLEVTAPRDGLTGDSFLPMTIRSLSGAGRPEPLVGGHVSVAWQKLDPALFGWKDYRFGVPSALLGVPAQAADFLTDLDGAAQIRLALPKPPQERGLYQAAIKVAAEAGAGVADAPPIILPLRPDGGVIGIKPLAAEARFPQNGIARFMLIALSSDGKPRDMQGLSYQVYEEGRSFAWYQDEGRWQYKPEPQLRPIGGGALSIRADGSMLEWPVTAGNYRLEILDTGGKTLAQTDFSASWDSTGAAVIPVLPLSLTLPKNLGPGHEAVAHVILPQPAMMTAIVADAKIRKVIHEFRGKGDNKIAFTPAASWQDTISLSVEAAPQNDRNAPMRATAEAAITQNKTDAVNIVSGVSIAAIDDPSALILRKGGAATLAFRIENLGDKEETFRYAFTASPGLKIDNSGKGSIAVKGGQSAPLFVPVSGVQAGVKELRLEISGAPPAARVSRSWAMGVLSKTGGLQGEETLTAAPRKILLPVATKSAPGETAAFISRYPMTGLAEILSYVFDARPFTTKELALSIDALRLWGPVLGQAGFAPDFLIEAKRRQQFMHMLRHQNADGGFAAWRGGDSTMEDTAAALTALGPETSDQVSPARNLAIGWIKQRLANTWVDEKERAPRAAAYAALAAADAIDASSLHYFSDTSAAAILPPVAEADIAAAFKHIRDPGAAAFWIRKMLDENGHIRTVPLLDALAATDALPSDDVHAAMAEMAELLKRGKAPDIADAAALLRALAADNADAGKWKLATGSETRDISGVLAVRGNDAAAANWRNGDAQSLSVTLVAESANPRMAPTDGASVARHVYRLNGVELSPSEKPVRDEIYMIEIKGAMKTNENEKILVQDGGDALRLLGCALSARIDTLSFIPWLMPRDLTSVETCEFSAHNIGAVLAPNENGEFAIAYFARIDANAAAGLAPPQIRILK